MRVKLLLSTLLIVLVASNGWAQQYSFNPTSIANNVFPFNSTTNRSQYLYLPSYFGSPVSGNITDVYFKASSSVSNISYTNLEIRIGSTTLTSMTSGPWVTGLTTVYNAAYTGSTIAGNWVKVTLQTPFPYNATQNIIVDCIATGYSPGFTGQHETSIPNSRLYGTSAAATGNVQPRLIGFGYDLISCTVPPPTVTPLVTLCQNSTASPLTASGSNLLWYTTPVGGVGSATAPTPSTASIGTTTYYVSQTTTCESVRDSIKVNVIPGGVPNITVNVAPNDTICSGQMANFTAMSNNAPPSATYQWIKNGNNITGATGFTYSSNLLNNGDDISCQITIPPSSGTCFSPDNAISAPIDMIVLNPPGASFTASSTAPICEPDSILLTANTGAGYTYQWDKNGSGIPGANSSVFAVKSSGNYRVRVYNIAGCQSMSGTLAFTVNHTPTSIIPTINPTSFCDGSGIVLQSTTGANPNFNHQWYRNGTMIQGATLWYYLVTASGNYNLEVSTNAGCTKTTNSVAISTFPLPQPIIVNNNNTLSVQGSYHSYQWYYNTHPISGATQSTFTPLQAGGYYVCVEDENGCQSCSDVFIKSELGIGELEWSKNIKIYPNPTQSAVQVESPKSISLTVNDVLGRNILPVQTGNKFQVTELAAGVYFFKIQDEQGRMIKVERVVKE